MLIVFTDFLFYDVMIREVDSGQEDCPGVPGFPPIITTFLISVISLPTFSGVKAC